MHVLITGMTSRMTSPTRKLGFPGLLAAALAAMGHETTMKVEYGGVDKYDAVIVGVASPLAPSSRYLVPAAQTIDEAIRQHKLAAVLLDDPQVEKIAHGTASALRKPSRLEKPFFASRPGMSAYLESRSMQVTVLSVLERMQSWDWPAVLWPAHPWASDRLKQLQAVGPPSVALEVTAPLLDLANNTSGPLAKIGSPPRGKEWLAETTYFDSYDFDPGISRSMFALTLGDRDITAVYRAMVGAYGVIHGNREFPGWWTPNICLAALAQRIIVPHIDEALLAGPSYYLLPSAVESLEPEDYTAVLQAQRASLEEAAWPTKRLHSTLHGVLGRTGN